MAFRNIQFPPNISRGMRGGPRYKTNVVVLDNGSEQRVQHWSRSRRVYTVSHQLRPLDDMREIQAFFMATKGRLHSFRLKDWRDYTATNEPLTDSASIQLEKTYTFGAYSEVRKITKPVSGTITIYKNAVALTETTDYTIDYSTGIVTILSYSSGTFTWSGQFDVHARFDIDNMEFESEDVDIHHWNDVILVEILDA